jgi:hypothetical protein
VPSFAELERDIHPPVLHDWVVCYVRPANTFFRKVWILVCADAECPARAGPYNSRESAYVAAGDPL